MKRFLLKVSGFLANQARMLTTILLTICVWYALTVLDTFLTNFLFTTMNVTNTDLPFRWAHRLLVHMKLAQIPADILAGGSAFVTGFILPVAAPDSLKSHPKMSWAIYILCGAIVVLSLFNVVMIDAGLPGGDPAVPGNPYFALQAGNLAALYFALTLGGVVTGFRLPKAPA